MATTATKKKTDDNGSGVTSAEMPQISIPGLQVKTIIVPIVGLTPVIPHKWSEKALRMMRDKQQGAKAKAMREPKNPEQEANDATYWMADGRGAIPAVSYKAAIVGACRYHEGITMVQLKTALFVQGDGVDQLVAINGDSEIHEDVTRNQTGVADLRYRRYFWPWTAELTIEFVTPMLDTQSVINLVATAGRGGVGDRRPSSPKSSTGIYGRFNVDTTRDVRVL